MCWAHSLFFISQQLLLLQPDQHNNTGLIKAMEHVSWHAIRVHNASTSSDVVIYTRFLYSGNCTVSAATTTTTSTTTSTSTTATKASSAMGNYDGDGGYYMVVTDLLRVWTSSCDHKELATLKEVPQFDRSIIQPSHTHTHTHTHTHSIST
jgi:hypothetical protein